MEDQPTDDQPVEDATPAAADSEPALPEPPAAAAEEATPSTDAVTAAPDPDAADANATRPEAEAIPEPAPEIESPDSAAPAAKTGATAAARPLPAFLRETPALILIGSGLVLALGLLVWIALSSGAASGEIPLIFDANAAPLRTGQPNDLYSLAIIGISAWLANTLLGAWLHWRKDAKFLAYVLWAGTVFVTLILWLAFLTRSA